MAPSSVNFRYMKKNKQSMAALLPLLPGASVVHRPCDGIMIYSFASAQAPAVFREVERSKTSSLFIGGGPHPSARPEETLTWFDFVVMGEGEETLPELIAFLQKGGDPFAVKGIAFKKNGRVRYNARREVIGLDAYPPFDPKVMNSSIEISRGCPFQCEYCQTPQLFGRTMRHRSIPVIAQYAQYLEDIRFTSPNAFAYGSDGVHPRIEKIEALLSALPSEKNIFFGTFPSEVRPEFITDRLLELVSDHCANTSLHMGGQSGSQEVLEKLHRGHAAEDIITAAERCFRHGFTPIVDFIFGLPCETEEEQLESLRIIRWLAQKGARIHSHYFTPLPGTPLEHAAPSTVSREVENVMGHLALHGKATGRWAKT